MPNFNWTGRMYDAAEAKVSKNDRPRTDEEREKRSFFWAMFYAASMFGLAVLIAKFLA